MSLQNDLAAIDGAIGRLTTPKEKCVHGLDAGSYPPCQFCELHKLRIVNAALLEALQDMLRAHTAMSPEDEDWWLSWYEKINVRDDPMKNNNYTDEIRECVIERARAALALASGEQK